MEECFIEEKSLPLDFLAMSEATTDSASIIKGIIKERTLIRGKDRR